MSHSRVGYNLLRLTTVGIGNSKLAQLLVGIPLVSPITLGKSRTGRLNIEKIVQAEMRKAARFLGASVEGQSDFLAWGQTLNDKGHPWATITSRAQELVGDLWSAMDPGELTSHLVASTDAWNAFFPSLSDLQLLNLCVTTAQRLKVVDIATESHPLSHSPPPPVPKRTEFPKIPKFLRVLPLLVLPLDTGLLEQSIGEKVTLNVRLRCVA